MDKYNIVIRISNKLFKRINPQEKHMIEMPKQSDASFAIKAVRIYRKSNFVGLSMDLFSNSSMPICCVFYGVATFI